MGSGASPCIPPGRNSGSCARKSRILLWAAIPFNFICVLYSLKSFRQTSSPSSPRRSPPFTSWATAHGRMFPYLINVLLRHIVLFCDLKVGVIKWCLFIAERCIPCIISTQMPLMSANRVTCQLGMKSGRQIRTKQTANWVVFSFPVTSASCLFPLGKPVKTVCTNTFSFFSFF